MSIISLETAVENVFERTRIVYLPYENPEKLRSRIGDVLHRAGSVPAWWRENGPLVPSPFRVAPDIDARLVRVQWLDIADDDMVPLVNLMFKGAKVERLTPNLDKDGNILTVQYLSPQYYTVGAAKYRKEHNHDDRDVPNLGLLIQFARKRNQKLISHWLDISLDQRNAAWFTKYSFELLDSTGKIVTLKHKAHRTGFEFRATGFVGQAVYNGLDEKATNEAHLWLQIATLWGAASGTTWGWSSLWETRFAADMTLREPEVSIN